MPRPRKEPTAAKTIRLTLYEWAELDYAAAKRGRNRNEEIRWRLAQHALPLPDAVAQGQISIFDELPGDGAGGNHERCED